jgi:hypothetical protein
MARSKERLVLCCDDVDCLDLTKLTAVTLDGWMDVLPSSGPRLAVLSQHQKKRGDSVVVDIAGVKEHGC